MASFAAKPWRYETLALAAVVLLTIAGGAVGIEEGGHPQCGAIAAASKPPKNIVLFIGDGMGQAHVTLARLVAQSRTGRRTLAFEGSLVGTARTKSLDHHITDSAASATALASGHR